MFTDPFFKPLGQMVPNLGRAFRKKPEQAQPLEEEAPPPVAVEEKAKPKSAKLRNPRWESAKVGFNEETPISVEVELPPEMAHKKRVSFELFAKTPKGPERISQGEAMEKDGKATCTIPVYIPNFRDEDGNRLQKVEYYFLATHSEAEPLDASKSPKLIDEMADRLIESHILPNITFATGSSFLHPNHIGELKGLRDSVRAWKKKTQEGKLAVFGHADAVGRETDNKALSERRARALLAFLTLDASGYAAVAKEENWTLDAFQTLLKSLGHDPGALDGKDGPMTQAAVKSFRKKQDLGESGGLDTMAKEKLYLAFFAEANSEAVLAKAFEDVNGNAFAGCSEFNLAEKTQGACEKNRRTGVFLLKATKNFPIHYPCAKGDIGTCKKQVTKKGERRTAGFGCWFYDQLIVERPNQPPPPPDEPISDLKWDVEAAWCGDTAKLTANSNLADGTEVAIKLATEDQACGEAKAKIQAGKLEFAWAIHNIPFSFGEDKKAKPEVEVFVEVTAREKKYNTPKNLKVKKVVTAKAVEYKVKHVWGKYGVLSQFNQSLENAKIKISLRKKVMQTWGATYVDLTRAGITDQGGGFPWDCCRWARSSTSQMRPDEYWDNGKWNKIPFMPMAPEYGTLPIIKTGNTFHWINSSGFPYPGTFPDYDWNHFEPKREAWTKDSNKRWTAVHSIKRKDCKAPSDKSCCSYDLVFDFGLEKVSTYDDEVLCLAPSLQRSNAGLLFYGDDRVAMCAHEAGHLVGLPDEYPGGAVDTIVNGDGAVNGIDQTTLMGSFLDDETKNQIKVRHYGTFALQMRKAYAQDGRKEEEWIVAPRKGAT